MINYDLTLKSRLLPAPVIISNFVSGDNIMYETYIIELLNNSQWFSSRYGNFNPPANESYGQCDSYAGNYGLDFKLIASQSELQAKSCMSAGKVVYSDGLRITTTSKKSGSMGAYILHKLLRNLTYQDLCDIENKSKVNKDENDVKAFLKLLRTQKNLLLFHPYEMFFDNNHSLQEGAQQICNAINSDFKTVMQYRLANSSCDNYMAFVYLDHFVILQYVKDKFEVIDYVELKKSKTFQKLWDYTW